MAKEKSGKRNKIDGSILIVTLILVIFGMLMIYSASSYTAQIEHGSSTFFLKKQIQATAIGFAGLFIAAIIPYEFWKSKVSIGIYLIATILIFFVLSPWGIESNGAKRWINLKVFTLQPAEVLKVAVILVTATLIVVLKDHLDEFKGFCFAIAPIILSALLVAVVTDDLGTAIIIFAFGMIMIFAVVPKKKYVLWVVLFVIAAAAVLVIMKPYRRLRIKSWLNIEAYAQKESYQIMQALYAIGSGGFTGKGIGKSTQKLNFLPESETDMIFSIVCEELGILGGIMLIVLIAILVWRLWVQFMKTEDIFGKLIIAGVASHIAVQTFINIGVVTSLIPNTGVPLPFISYGGSSIMMLLTEIGLVISVSRGRKDGGKRSGEPEKPVIREDKDKGVIYYR